MRALLLLVVGFLLVSALNCRILPPPPPPAPTTCYEATNGDDFEKALSGPCTAILLLPNTDYVMPNASNVDLRTNVTVIGQKGTRIVATNAFEYLFLVLDRFTLYNVSLVFVGPDSDDTMPEDTQGRTSAIRVGATGRLSMFGVSVIGFPYGGVVVYGSFRTELFIQDCRFENNGRRNESAGGAIQFNFPETGIIPYQSMLTLVDGVFLNNAASYGGAIGVVTKSVYQVDLEMVWRMGGNLEFDGNSADFNGGAISFDCLSRRASIEIILIPDLDDIARWYFTNNTAQIEGGAFSSSVASFFMARENGNWQSHLLNFTNNRAPVASAMSLGSDNSVTLSLAFLFATGNNILAPHEVYSTQPPNNQRHLKDEDPFRLHPSVFRFHDDASQKINIANELGLTYNFGNVLSIETRVEFTTNMMVGSYGEMISFNSGGSAIYVAPRTLTMSLKPSVWNCRDLWLRNNTADMGGAIHARGPLTFTGFCGLHCEGNKARLGGAIYVDMDFEYNYNLLNLSVFSNFIDNVATVNGGAIHAVDERFKSRTNSPLVWGPDGSYFHTNFVRNIAYQQGGAVFTSNPHLLARLWTDPQSFRNNQASQGCVFSTRTSIPFFGNATCPISNSNYTLPSFRGNSILPGAPQDWNPAFRCPFEDYECADPSHPDSSCPDTPLIMSRSKWFLATDCLWEYQGNLILNGSITIQSPLVFFGDAINPPTAPINAPNSSEPEQAPIQSYNMPATIIFTSSALSANMPALSFSGNMHWPKHVLVNISLEDALRWQRQKVVEAILMESGSGVSGDLPQISGIIYDSPHYDLAFDYFISSPPNGNKRGQTGRITLSIGNIHPVYNVIPPSLTPETAPHNQPGEHDPSFYRTLSYVGLTFGLIGLFLACLIPTVTCHRHSSACFRKAESSRNQWVTDEETSSLLSVNQ